VTAGLSVCLSVCGRLCLTGARPGLVSQVALWHWFECSNSQTPHISSSYHHELARVPLNRCSAAPYKMLLKMKQSVGARPSRYAPPRPASGDTIYVMYAYG